MRRPFGSAALALVAAPLLLAACSGSVDVAPPDLGGASSTASLDACTQLTADLPEQVAEQKSRSTAPESPLTAAWGEPAILLRCGVPRPEALTAASRAGERERRRLVRRGADGRIRLHDRRPITQRRSDGPRRLRTRDRAGHRAVAVRGSSHPAADQLSDPVAVGHRRPRRFSSAVRISRVTSSGYSTPDACHMRGKSEMWVNPGMVLISLRTTSPDSVTKKSMRA